jgi:hypothetical protein
MMRDDSAQILDDLLSRWHGYCQGYRLSAQSADPMFRQALRAKGEQTLEAISEDQWHKNTMKAIDFHVGEMADPYRAAIYILARNLHSGRQVWLSPRLPSDPLARGEVVAKARTMLMERLFRAGVM